MFNKLFGTNHNFDDDAKSGPVADAKSIQETTDYVIIKAAWEEYAAIKRRDPDFQEGDIPEGSTPAWEALNKIIEVGGNFDRLMPDNRQTLINIQRGFLLYSDVLHVLIDHHDDEEAGHEIYEKYPELHDHIPAEYDDDAHVLEVFAEVVKDYQWQLEHFATKHAKAIEHALEH